MAKGGAELAELVPRASSALLSLPLTVLKALSCIKEPKYSPTQKLELHIITSGRIRGQVHDTQSEIFSTDRESVWLY
jgi:hypothetical protein